jgi:hypothetical protein
MGTPNPIGKLGTLWDRWKLPANPHLNSTTADPAPGFHYFTAYDNTALGTPERIEEIIQELLTEEQETKEGSWYRREICALWEVDKASKVYAFTDELNVHAELPDNLTHHIVIFDIGHTAADAVGCWGWTDTDPTLRLAKESVKTGQTVTDLGDILREWNSEFPDVVDNVGDPGGVGAKTLAELKQQLPDLPISGVKKPEINLQVKIINAFLKRGGLTVPADSRVAAEIRVPVWENGIVNSKIDEGGVHSDAVPMARYACIAATPHLPEAAIKETPETRRARLQAEARQKRVNAALKKSRRKTPEDNFNEETTAEPVYGGGSNDFDDGDVWG